MTRLRDAAVERALWLQRTTLDLTVREVLRTNAGSAITHMWDI